MSRYNTWQISDVLMVTAMPLANGTLMHRLRDSLGCKDCCANTNSLTYLLIK